MKALTELIQFWPTVMPCAITKFELDWFNFCSLWLLEPGMSQCVS